MAQLALQYSALNHCATQEAGTGNLGIPLNISRFLGIMLKNRSQSWSYAGTGYFNKTTTQNTAQNLRGHLCRGTSTMFWNGHPSPQTWISLRICGMIWSGLSMLGNHAVHARQPSKLTELEMFYKKEWSKIASSRIQTLIRGIRGYGKRLDVTSWP
jgi:hypothetical protein